MRTTITLTAAALALVISTHSASAQRESGGGTIGCDPGNPTLGTVKATDCSVFHKEALYGPSANPYAAAWDHGTPVVRHKKVVRPKKSSSVSRSGASSY